MQFSTVISAMQLLFPIARILLSGSAALSYRKGGPRHSLAGKVFVLAMLTMSSAAVYLAILKHQPSNIGGGILTFYLITTAWFTARRKDGETSKLDSGIHVWGRAPDSLGGRYQRLDEWFASLK